MTAGLAKIAQIGKTKTEIPVTHTQANAGVLDLAPEQSLHRLTGSWRVMLAVRVVEEFGSTVHPVRF